MTDVQVRKIKLVNETGREFNLLGNYDQYPFLMSPKGFGLDYTMESTPILNGQEVLNKTNAFSDITGIVLFDSYSKYDEFIAYIGISKKLRLYYQNTLSFDEEYYNVEMKSIELTEKDLSGMLQCPIVFQKLSYLKKDNILSQTNQSTAVGHSTYPLGVDTPYLLYGSSYINTLNFTITSKTPHLIPARLEIIGGYTAPLWINHTNGLEGGYSISEPNGELVIDANYPQVMQSNGEDISQKQDRSKENFLLLSPGKNEISITTSSPSGSPTQTKVTIYWSDERG